MDKIFVDEAVNELQTIQDMLRWSVSRFSAANIWYGHGTDNPWDEAVQLTPVLRLSTGCQCRGHTDIRRAETPAQHV